MRRREPRARDGTDERRRPPTPSPSSPRTESRGRGPRHRPSPTAVQDPDAFADALAPASGARRSRVPRGPAADRPRHRRRLRRPLAADGRRSRAASGSPPSGDRPRRSCSSPTGCSTRTSSSRAGSPSGSSSGRSAAETERTWQLLRRAAREAGDWITVDSLAHPYGKGIAAEPYRWAELEQLVYSPVALGATPRRLHDRDDDPRRPTPRPRPRGRRATRCELLGQLIGDAEPDVQKALSWAYRSLTVVDMDATTAALRARDGRRAVAHGRRPSGLGHPRYARQARSGRSPTPPHRLAGIRKRAGAPSTSKAAADRRPLRWPARPDHSPNHRSHDPSQE